jgi:hypothetical protein
MRNEGRKVKAGRLGKNGKSCDGNSWSFAWERNGAIPNAERKVGSAELIKIRIRIMNDEGQEIAMICRHSGFDRYFRLFPGFPILGYSRNFENSGKNGGRFRSSYGSTELPYLRGGRRGRNWACRRRTRAALDNVASITTMNAL